jgi:hypothetical protein
MSGDYFLGGSPLQLLGFAHFVGKKRKRWGGTGNLSGIDVSAEQSGIKISSSSWGTVVPGYAFVCDCIAGAAVPLSFCF